MWDGSARIHGPREHSVMKRLLLLAIVVLMMSAGSTEAARNRYSSNRSFNRNSGIFSRMMELERRKNARLREMFFDR